VHTETLQRAVEEHEMLPEAWQQASTLSDWRIRLTPRCARALLETIEAVIEDIEEDPAEAPGAEFYRVVLHAFPQPGIIATREPQR
ncbi:MAG: hypothetical protein J7480_06845, partial [Microbacteriaceae bacterium]|nr:hypothetical protein [Microbacteriaceae bacterium]